MPASRPTARREASPGTGCLFASNFPVDSLASDYDAIWHAVDQITADFSSGERQKLFHDNAAHFYRLGK